MKLKLLAEIFVTFFKISPVTFGGGFAMIPVLERELAEKKKWIESDKIMDLFALSQSVPGAVAVNSSIFLGYHLAGLPGAAAAAIGMVLPAFSICMALAVCYLSFSRNRYADVILDGFKPVVIALVASAACKMGKASLIDFKSWGVCLVCFSILSMTGVNIALVIVMGALAGILLYERKMIFGKIQKIFQSKR